MNRITDVLRDSKRMRLIATALELMQYERGDSAVIPIPGTDPQRYVTIGTAATVAQLLEIAPAATASASGENAELVELLKEIRPNYGAVGSRDVDVAAQQLRIDRAIELLSAGVGAQKGGAA